MVGKLTYAGLYSHCHLQEVGELFELFMVLYFAEKVLCLVNAGIQLGSGLCKDWCVLR